jgi:hypothetical protein
MTQVRDKGEMECQDKKNRRRSIKKGLKDIDIGFVAIIIILPKRQNLLVIACMNCADDNSTRDGRPAICVQTVRRKWSDSK